jgi:hypothetical protein
MGKIPAGIMGGIKGKVGGIIGASWHGINYIKSYVIPTNPNSSGQQSQRSKMTMIQLIVKYALTGIIQPFWNPYAEYKSGVHLFISHNLLRLGSTPDFSEIQLAHGALEIVTPASSPGITYSTVTGNVTFDWNNDCYGNGLQTDLMAFFAYDEGNNVGFVDVGSEVRATEVYLWNIGPGRDSADIHGWMFPYRDDGGLPFQADSTYLKAT